MKIILLKEKYFLKKIGILFQNQRLHCLVQISLIKIFPGLLINHDPISGQTIVFCKNMLKHWDI